MRHGLDVALVAGEARTTSDEAVVTVKSTGLSGSALETESFASVTSSTRKVSPLAADKPPRLDRDEALSTRSVKPPLLEDASLPFEPELDDEQPHERAARTKSAHDAWGDMARASYQPNRTSSNP